MQYTKAIKENLREVLDLLANAKPDTVITLDSKSAELLLTYIAILQHGVYSSQLLRTAIKQQVRKEMEKQQPAGAQQAKVSIKINI